MKQFVGIQYLRAVAAIGVVVFHAAHRTHSGFAVGSMGVDVFFVISGFIMWTVASRKRHGATGFLADRLRRIGPPYWIATLVLAVGAAAGLFPRLTLSADHLLSSLLFLPAVSPANGRMWPVLVQGWTLNLEMLFYLIFACLLGMSRTPRLVALCAILLGLVGLGTLLPGVPVAVFYGSPLLIEFALGAIIGEALLRGRIPRANTGWLLMATSAGGFAAIHFGWLPFAILPGAMCATALVLGAVAVERGGRMPRWPTVAFLGDASYSIYLWHTFGVGMTLRAARAAGWPPGLTVLPATLAGVGLGLLMYRVVERPLNTWLAGRRQAAPEQSPVPQRLERLDDAPRIVARNR